MGIGAAIIIGSLVAGGVALKQSSDAKKEASKNRKQQRALAAQNKDKKVATGKGVAKKNARSALVVGSPQGILSEDGSATSGRGNLLGN